MMEAESLAHLALRPAPASNGGGSSLLPALHRRMHVIALDTDAPTPTGASLAAHIHAPLI